MTDEHETDDPNEPHQYYDPNSGLEQCPGCGTKFGTEAGYLGEVYDKNGTHYEYFHDSDPMDMPFRCPDCWKDHQAWIRSQENKSLEDYV